MLYRRLLIAILSSLAIFSSPASALSQGPFVGQTTGKLAVTPAGYDDMGQVLEALGFKAETIQEEDLASLTKLENYDAIYINCSGSIDNVAEKAATALRDYVQNGGIVYTSDYANSLIQAAFPGKINFYKGSSVPGLGEEGASLSSRVGVPGKVEAKVVDPGLAGVLGKSTIEVNYDLGAWVVIESAGAGATVHMEGPVKIMDFSSADPNTLQDFGNIDWTNPNAVEEFNKKWASTGKSIGDKPYVVSFSEGKGEVLYTTFHNEAQVTSDVKSVLNWFALKGKAGKLSRALKELVVKGEDKVLQEMVDGINQGETKEYLFNATGEADFSVGLNFGGSALSLVVTDPEGKQVIKETVSQPPFTKIVTAKKGKYTLGVKGEEVTSANMPFVLAISGPAKAAATPIVEEQKPQVTTTEKTRPILTYIIIGAAGLVFLILILVLVIFLSRRKASQT